MLSDFSAAAKNARSQLPVPPFDVDAIRARSAAGDARERLRRLVTGAAVGLGIAGAATAFASTVSGWHIWFVGNRIETTVASLGLVRYPQASDVRKLVFRAAFPIVLPDGVPHGLRITGIAYSPIDQPTLMTVQYGNASNPYVTSVTVVDTEKLSADQKLLPPDSTLALQTKGSHFQVGRETVLLGSRLSTSDAHRIETAMTRESPAQTATAFDALLTRLIILQKVPPQVVDAAEHLAPPGENVVIGDWDLRTMPHLVSHGQPLRDSRTIYLTNIPQVHGQPDYRNATLSWPKAIVLAPEGVRAVAAAMERSRTSGKCDCAFLVHVANGTYSIWRIDRTLQVKRLE
jgi:hypothetical protein